MEFLADFKDDEEDSEPEVQKKTALELKDKEESVQPVNKTNTAMQRKFVTNVPKWASDDESETESEEEDVVKVSQSTSQQKNDKSADPQERRKEGGTSISLPSIKDLLNSVETNSFSFTSSKPPNDDYAPENILASFKTHTYDEVEVPEKKSTPKLVSKPAMSFEELKAKTAAATASSTASSGNNRKTVRDKETAKERVKKQRLTGQSGIGDDFRSWRSEEEMRNRQQFD
jgi:hypothetical protein